MSSFRNCTPIVFCVGRPRPPPDAAVAEPGAAHEAVIRLLELIAVHRVVEEVGEVREEVEVVLEAVGA